MSDEYRVSTDDPAGLLAASEAIFADLGFLVEARSSSSLSMSLPDAHPSTRAFGGQISLCTEPGGVFVTLNLPGSPSAFVELFRARLASAGRTETVEEA